MVQDEIVQDANDEGVLPGSSGRIDRPIPWWLCAIVAVGAVLMVVGAVLALVRPGMLASPHDEINGAVHIYAGYVASRNLAIGLLLLATLILRFRGALSSLMVLYAFIQFIDVGIDCLEGRWVIIPGILILGLAFLFGSSRVAGYPFWKLERWKNGR